MSTQPTSFSSFNITSGRLAFGGLHNLWQTSQSPHSRKETEHAEYKEFGRYSVPARLGSWNAYQLQWLKTSIPGAWFACHIDQDPNTSLRKILRVAGSPYQRDPGQQSNNDETRAEGVYLINRYDWCYYDETCQSDIIAMSGDYDAKAMFYDDCIGLIDQEHTETQVKIWACQDPRQRQPSPNGVWMHTPGSEYNFGRILFDNNFNEARAFLLFHTTTEFEQINFPGMQEPIIKHEPDEEWFLRIVSEGRDLSGIQKIHDFYKPLPNGLDHMAKSTITPPPEDERLGPFDPKHYILDTHDLQALLIHSARPRKIPAENSIDEFYTQPAMYPPRIPEQWRTHVLELLNELVLTYLYTHALTFRSCKSIDEIEKITFDRKAVTGNPHSDNLESHLLAYFCEPRALQVRDLNLGALGVRIRAFLEAFAGDEPVALDDECMLGFARAVAKLVIDLLRNAPGLPGVGHIVPEGIRLTVYFDDALLGAVCRSSFFWSGRP